MTTPLSRLQHDISLAPGIPDSYRLFGEGPTVSTYGDLREVVRQLDVRHLTSAERAWGEEAASVAISAVPPSQGMETRASVRQTRNAMAFLADFADRARKIEREGGEYAEFDITDDVVKWAVPPAQPHPDVTGLVEALKRARSQFHSYAMQHKAKGTADGDAKALTNAAYAEDMQRALAAFQSRQEEGA